MNRENILLKSALALAIVDLVLIAAILLQVNGLVKDVLEVQDKQLEIEVMKERLERAEEAKVEEKKTKEVAEIKDSLTVDSETGWQVYRNYTFGYEIKFPKELKGEFVDTVIEPSRFKVSSPVQLNEFGFIKDGAQFTIFVSKNVAGYTSPHQFDGGEEIGGVTLSRDIRLGGRNAFQQNFEGTSPFAPQNTTPLITSKVHYVDEKKIIEIKFNSGGENRYKFLNLFEQIINTFKFID